MRFVSAELGGRRFATVIEGDRAIPIRGVAEIGLDTDAQLLAAPPLDRAGAVSLSDVHLRPVVPRLGKIICVGVNYRGHANEVGREEPSHPVLFTKFAESLIGPSDDICKPLESDAMDFEVERAVVIGRTVRRANRSQAMSAVAGLAVANDVTMHDYQRRSSQWLQGKAWERSTPLGPHLVTLDEVDLRAGP